MYKSFEIKRIDLDKNVASINMDGGLLFTLGKILRGMEDSRVLHALGCALTSAGMVIARQIDIDSIEKFDDVEVVEDGEVLAFEEEKADMAKTDAA